MAEDSDEDLGNSVSKGGRFRDAVSRGEIEGKELTLGEYACGYGGGKEGVSLKERSVNEEKEKF